jgi:hypothetical protein
MKILFSVSAVLPTVLFAASFALANPAMLPNHPGYPMDKAVDPVHGQSLANDPGQSNPVGDNALTEAATSADAHVRQKLPFNRQDKRILEKPGAGLLPKVDGPNIVITPPVNEATRMKATPK